MLTDTEIAGISKEARKKIEVDPSTPPGYPLAKCQLCACRLDAKQPLPGRGNFTTAKVAIVGVSPSGEEDQEGKIFHEAKDNWQEIRKWVDRLGLKEADIYLTNIVKCRTKDRTPTAKEVGTCRDMWLARELYRLPELRAIITLGRQTRDGVIVGKSTVPLTEASRADIMDGKGRIIAVFPLPNPMYYVRAKEERAYLLKVVLPEVRKQLIALGVV